MWQSGYPSSFELAAAATSLFSWMGAKAFSLIFILAGPSFFVCDLRRSYHRD